MDLSSEGDHRFVGGAAGRGGYAEVKPGVCSPSAGVKKCISAYPSCAGGCSAH